MKEQKIALHTNSPLVHLSLSNGRPTGCLVCFLLAPSGQRLPFWPCSATFSPSQTSDLDTAITPPRKPARSTNLHGTYIDQVRSTESQPSGTSASGLPGYPHLISLPFLGRC